MSREYPYLGPCDFCSKDVPTRYLKDSPEEAGIYVCEACSNPDLSELEEETS